jgi:DNA modification methylase
MKPQITDQYAIYNQDCIPFMQSMPDSSIGLSIYSPPFRGIYQYSSSERDLSNCRTKEQFMEHYDYVVRELFRITPPGRISAVHCAEIPSGNSGCDHLQDFPGDIIRLHEKIGFHFAYRIHIWKEPLAIRNKLMLKNLFHSTLCEDSTRVGIANADYLLVFRKRGKNKVPVEHPVGLTDYAGSREMPTELIQYRGWKGSQLENRYSHWIWQRYASSNWDDIRLSNILPYQEIDGEEDGKHLHPMPLDIYNRAMTLWSNPGEVVFDPFMGVGSCICAAIKKERLGMGVELKESFYKQAVKNIEISLRAPEKPKQLDACEVFGMMEVKIK